MGEGIGERGRLSVRTCGVRKEMALGWVVLRGKQGGALWAKGVPGDVGLLGLLREKIKRGVLKKRGGKSVKGVPRGEARTKEARRRTQLVLA